MGTEATLQGYQTETKKAPEKLKPSLVSHLHTPDELLLLQTYRDFISSLISNGILSLLETVLARTSISAYRSSNNVTMLRNTTLCSHSLHIT